MRSLHCRHTVYKASYDRLIRGVGYRLHVLGWISVSRHSENGSWSQRLVSELHALCSITVSLSSIKSLTTRSQNVLFSFCLSPGYTRRVSNQWYVFRGFTWRYLTSVSVALIAFILFLKHGSEWPFMTAIRRWFIQVTSSHHATYRRLEFSPAAVFFA